ncbi:hypothetical protein SULI_07715 [Saccharolobus solfataricus]|uniref:DUF5658 domain-containing protein n=3 Tax=Saccharolobus solfataricus TaxID=2287 RepID=Q7LXW8_SACS2|nr:hypothetical protein [Saccharolobus solfataricus]AAK40841.1 Hypothetical protein SSO0523 [Saccharolobus solfataricus P2]AKA73811.1 hypothetical protein SULB_1547 [Saccharolobus solfataricus]AKA76508.1 hypothetical protein SULC_1545 [Saccharolobus solfataricus]AKA79201.1 hypothetical protein SULA_1546 [Saccharolobus solfataricus]AZF68287.1 hypothetical protein SULG_07715 [Saccharolobus solfataricus]
MRILKIVWVLFILLNVYDVVISAIYAIPGTITDGAVWETNLIISLYAYYEGSISFVLAVLMLISLKLLLFTGVYWYTKLFDLLKVSKYKWLSLLPFIAVSFLVDLGSTSVLISQHIPPF